MKSLYLLLLLLISSSYAAEKQPAKPMPVLFQENLIISNVKDYKKLGDNSWFFQKISTIKNQKDQELLGHLVYTLNKICETTIEKINSLKKNFENFYQNESGQDEIQKNTDELNKKLEECVYLKNLIKNIVEFCLKNSTEDESAIEKALGEKSLDTQETKSESLSNLKKVFEQIIQKVEDLKKEEEQKETEKQKEKKTAQKTLHVDISNLCRSEFA